MENSIFISYSHSDRAAVEQIAGVIKEASGMPVWYDSNLRGGENYFSVIADQIVQCGYFVFVVSDHSIASDWCLRELEFAASERKRIIAVWLDNVSISPRVKLIIQNTHYINYYSGPGDAFFNAVSRAFQGDPSRLSAGGRAQDDGGDSVWNETYFLDTEELKRIADLLAKEKKNEYSVCFRPENAYRLGIAYELGVNVAADAKRAAFYYRVSSYRGSAEGKYLYAAILSKREDADLSALLARKLEAAEAGSVYALTYLGEDYYYGRNGCPPDKEKAYAFWKTAAEAGSVLAMYSMAFGCERGECVEKDFELAYMYTLMAIEHGFPRAYRMLGFMYWYGEFFDEDDDKAVEMFEEAISRGDHLSYCYLGRVYGYSFKNYEKQKECYEKAFAYAEEGKIRSGLPYYRMGNLYDYGRAVPQDKEKAVELYLKSAEKKTALALGNTVDTILEIGDPEKKEAYLLRAFALGCRNAAYELARIERSRGDGDSLSEKAVSYYEKGAEEGDLYCAIELFLHYSVVCGSGNTKEDRDAAIRWFRFFFANADDEFLKDLKNLATYYYAYAIELDYAPGGDCPDRDFVRRYFIKSLDVSMTHYQQIVHFIVNGYLFPEESGSELPTDVAHAREMLEVLEGYLPAYSEYLSGPDADPAEAPQRRRETLSLFERGYTKISDCYAKGRFVHKDAAVSLQYKKKAQEMRLRLQQNDPSAGN